MAQSCIAILSAALRAVDRWIERWAERTTSLLRRIDYKLMQYEAPLKKGTRVRVTASKCCAMGRDRVGETGTIHHVVMRINRGDKLFEYYVEPDMKRHDYDYLGLCTNSLEVIK